LIVTVALSGIIIASMMPPLHALAVSGLEEITVTATPSAMPSETGTPTPTASPSPTPSSSPSPTASLLPTSTLTPSLTPSPIPTRFVTATPGERAQIEGLVGHKQSMPLSCEASAAVDWAAYFGIRIDEEDFFNRLPKSENPDRGFVGDVHGSWGQIPPNPYGVHARPVAQTLRSWGLPARAVRPLPWNILRAEIAAGQPVIVWVVGHVESGTPVPYTASDGHETIVSPYQHTVIVIGYTPESVTILDGEKTYTRSLKRFFESWGVLGEMAVIWDG
jgi:uncharacterized protein YvpB